MERYAILMAGGSGLRLWPFSRKKKPKQFISADSGPCMMLETLERIRPVVPPDNCFVVTSRTLEEITRSTLKGTVPESNIILEPMPKNTAACIAYAVFTLKSKGIDGVLCFFPADGYVKNRTEYCSAVSRAYAAAEHTEGLVVIGLKPSRPATGYGYLRIGPGRPDEARPVLRFVEKPDRSTAEKFLSSGDYLWNSGIVAGRLSSFSAHIRSFLPEHSRIFSEAMENPDGQAAGPSIQKAYSEIPDLSFDKGVLEKSGDIAAVEGNFDWDDIGSLEGLAVPLRPDPDGNRVKGAFFGVDTKDCIIYGNQTLVAAIGMENVVIALTDDAILVCPRSRAQDVKTLVERLKNSQYKQFS